MLRVTQIANGENATRYFDVALKRSEYYASEYGQWGGRGAERLGLRDDAERDQFVRLMRNETPDGKGQLTVRLKEDRTVGYDWTFAVPKSLSLYLAETDDRAVERMIHEAFKETMADVESRMETRVRIGGQSEGDRTTGEMVYASFVHKVTRPIDGISDPHWHIHGLVVNATFDSVENRWKAGQFKNLKADAPFYEASFNARLADKLIAKGFGIRRTDRSFELASVSQETVEKFSKRTVLIEKLAREQHTVIEARARALMEKTGMEFSDAFAMTKSELGARTREKKSAATLDGTALLDAWRSQMTPGERQSLQRESVKGIASKGLVESEMAKDLAVDHVFERSSISRELNAAAMFLRRGIGKVSVDEARDFARSDPRFIRKDAYMTTTKALEEEKRTLEIARAGQGKFEPIGDGELLPDDWKKLSEEQAEAVRTILDSRDLVTTLHGPAGSGKTSLARATVQAIETRHEVIMLAPSASAVKVLKDEGFSKSETFQKFQGDPLIQDVAAGQVLWVDEAGFLSSRQMHWLVNFADQHGCKVILSGDTRQHHAVERGDALRVLEDADVVTQATLSKIVRQQIEPLRDAVTDLSKGRAQEGFDKLDAYGAVHEIEDKAERLATIVDIHLAARARGESSLIVAPTHAECRSIADEVRKRQKTEGILGSEDHTVNRLAKLNTTTSQRRDPINYQPGQVIEFHRRAAGGFKSGERWQVRDSAIGGKVVVTKDGQSKVLPLSQAKAFDLYTREQMPLTSGDTVRITKNFRTNGGKFRNNELATVWEINGETVTFTDGRTMPTSAQLHLDQGIAVTSHASQGKTVDHVIVSAPVEAFAQVNQAQFYVSMSRARSGMHLVTDSKVALREAVSQESQRVSALELIKEYASLIPRHVVDLQEYARRAAAFDPPSRDRGMDRTL